MPISEMPPRNDGGSGSGSGSGSTQDAARFANAGLLLATQETEGRKRKRKKKKPPPPPPPHKDGAVEMMAEAAGYVYLREDAEEGGSRVVIIGEDRASMVSCCLGAVGADRGVCPCISGKEEKKVTGLFREGGAAAMAAGNATIGLELGKRTYFEEASAPNGTSGQSSAQAPIQMKRPRVLGQTPKCQAEGCKADLSCVKDYHRRHKVCDFHSKASKAVVGGREQRFCQQCSRFHGLIEFDEGKRSCRQRLAGHNERRRKPQPDALRLSASLLPAFQVLTCDTDDRSRKLGHFYMDGVSFLALPGISTVLSTAPCDDCEVAAAPSPLKGASWPASFEMSKPSNPVLVTDLHHLSARSPLFNSFPQSPKAAIPAAKDAKAPQYFHHHQHQHQLHLLQGHGVKSPVVESLSLASSLASSGSRGVPSADGLEALHIGQGYMTGVLDSGRALSLQSNMQQRSSSSAVFMDSKAHPSMVSDQGLDATAHDPVPLSAEPLGQTGEQQQQQQQQQHYHHQHHYEWMNEKLFSASSAGYGAEDSNMIEKDLLERSLAGTCGGGNYESSLPPPYSFLGDVKPTTIDLLQISSATSHGSQSTLAPSGAYEIGFGPFGDLQAIRSFDSPSIFSSQQM